MAINKFNYSLISKFNEIVYSNLLFKKNLCGQEVFVKDPKDMYGDPIIVKDYFYPLAKDNKVYLLQSDLLNMLPVEVEVSEKIAIEKKGYHLIRNANPKGFGEEKTFETFTEFINSFCDFEHENVYDFILWKIVCMMSYVTRVNVRISSNPAFGKDSVLKVINGFMGDISIVHNPTMAKIEWLLSSKVLVTNEVAGIKTADKENLQQYYLTCGDFSESYTKRTRATAKDSEETYNISNLSNIIMFNDMDCYNDKDKEKYFDNVFQKAVRERFLPLKFSGKITEKFSIIRNTKEEVETNMEYYKKTIKYIKYLSNNYEKELHNYKLEKTYSFSDRALRNWETILHGIDMYSINEEMYQVLVQRLFQKNQDYLNMVMKDRQRDDNTLRVYTEEKVA